MLFLNRLCLVLLVFSFFHTCGKEEKRDEFSLNLKGKKGAIPVRIEWIRKGVPGKMELYELAAQKPVQLWDTKSVASLEQAPISTPIEASTLLLSPGELRRFALVYKNDTKEDLFFFAAPHSVTPPEFGFGFKFKCLCVNHLFKVESGHVWYRIVELRTMPNWASEEFSITHTLVRVDPFQAKEWESSRSRSIPED